MFNKEWVDNIMGVISTIGAGALSSSVYYIYSVMKGEPFRIWFFLGQMLIGVFVALVVDQFMPHDWSFRIGVVFICGFLATKILDFVNDNGLNILLKKVNLDNIQSPPEKKDDVTNI